jgi:hypothetical protein
MESPNGLAPMERTSLRNGVAVVPLVSDHEPRLESFQHDFRAGYVVPLPFRQMQLDRLALAADCDVDSYSP